MGFRSTIDWVKAKAILYHIGHGSMHAAADYMAARAVDYAPVDTGFMSYNIKVYARYDDIVATVVSTAYYSQWVEFGHRTTWGTWVPAQPFMRPAMMDMVREFPEIVRKYSTSRPLSGGSAEPFLATQIAF